jgi:mevalonate kinase
VYARPAIAVPVFQVRAEATIAPRQDARAVIDARDVARAYDLDTAPADDPLATIIRATCARLSVAPQNFSVTIRSTIPIASGLGSGAAVSVAVARALSRYFARLLPREEIAALAYETEKLHHGTPSGIDNTVIAFEMPIYFVRGQPIETFRVARAFTLAIADTGVASPTKIAVGDVRHAWEQDRARYESLFDQVGAIARAARAAIERGEVDALGGLIGLAAGYAVAVAVRTAVASIPAYVSVFWTVMGVLLSALTGIVFGYWPADRAARLDPVVCLRYE